MSLVIRLANESDAEQILAIYQPLVYETACTLASKPPTAKALRHQIRQTLTRLPWLVCERNRSLLGYAYATPYRPHATLAWSVEVAIYMAPPYQRRGIGRALYTSLLRVLLLQGFVHACALIVQPNPPACALHRSLGFQAIGVQHAAAYKLHAWHDLDWWCLRLQSPASDPSPPADLTLAQISPDWEDALAAGLVLLDNEP